MSKDNRNSKENKKEKQNKRLWTILISLIILLVALIGLSIYLMQNKEKEDENTLAYTDLIKEISAGNIEKIEMQTGSTTVKVKIRNEEEEKTAIVPNTESFITLVQSKVEEGNEE